MAAFSICLVPALSQHLNRGCSVDTCWMRTSTLGLPSAVSLGCCPSEGLFPPLDHVQGLNLGQALLPGAKEIRKDRLGQKAGLGWPITQECNGPAWGGRQLLCDHGRLFLEASVFSFTQWQTDVGPK